MPPASASLPSTPSIVKRSALDLWEQTVTALQDTMRAYDFQHWIKPIQCAEVNDDRGEIVLDVPDDSHGRWLEEHFLTTIRQALIEHSGTEYQVQFRSPDRAPIPPEPAQSTAPTIGLSATTPAPIEPPELVARYRFDTFVDGPQSRFALTAARAVAAPVAVHPTRAVSGAGAITHVVTGAIAAAHHTRAITVTLAASHHAISLAARAIVLVRCCR